MEGKALFFILYSFFVFTFSFWNMPNSTNSFTPDGNELDDHANSKGPIGGHHSAIHEQLEKRLLQAELKHQKLLTEHNALMVKVAEMEKEQQKMAYHLAQKQNEQKELWVKVDELEQKQTADSEQLKTAKRGILVKIDERLLQAELKHQKLLTEHNALKEKMAEMEKERNDLAAQFTQFANYQKKILERIDELDKRQTSKIEQMDNKFSQKFSNLEKIIGELKIKVDENFSQHKNDRKSYDGKPIFIRAFANNKFVSAWNADSLFLAARAESAGDWERFLMVTNDDGTVSLRSMANGNFVCADLLHWAKLNANRQRKDKWEKFRLIQNSDESVAFQAVANGRFVCADLSQPNAALIANRAKIDTWEKFKLINSP